MSDDIRAGDSGGVLREKLVVDLTDISPTTLGKKSLDPESTQDRHGVGNSGRILREKLVTDLTEISPTTLEKKSSGSRIYPESTSSQDFWGDFTRKFVLGLMEFR